MQFYSNRTRGRYSPSLDITPLIDVVFLLLVFLLLTMTFSDDKSQVEEAIIEIELANASEHAEPSKAATEVVLVDENGRLYRMGSAVAQTQEELRLHLSEAYLSHPDLVVQIKSDKRTPHGDVVKAIDVVKSLGIQSVQLVIESGE